MLYAQGKAAEGAAAEKKALELDPQSPDLPWLIGRRLLRDGDAAGAVASIQRAVNGDGKRVAFYVDLTQALLATEGGAQKAAALLQKATARVGDHPRMALLLGDAYRAAGDADRARGQYERSIQLGKPFPDARVALARLLRDQKNVPAGPGRARPRHHRVRAGEPGRRRRGLRGDGRDRALPRHQAGGALPALREGAGEGPGPLRRPVGRRQARRRRPRRADEAALKRLDRYVRALPAGANVAAAKALLAAAGAQ